MKKLSIIGFLLLLLFQTACREEFGKLCLDQIRLLHRRF